MAIYHLRVKFVQRSMGRSAVAAAAYRSGSKLVDERRDSIEDYTRKRDVEHSEIILPDHMPVSLAERGVLWNAIETGIKHPRGQPAFEVEVALPRELSKAQCVQLVREFARDHFVAEGLPVDINIHRTKASDGGEHPHAHILISTRRFHADGSLDKAARDLQDNPKLVAKIYSLEKEGKIDEALVLSRGTNLLRWRKAWGDYSNRFLSDADSESRVDHRTLAAQAIEREPVPNIGFAFYDRLQALTGRLADRVQAFSAVDFRNAMRGQMERIMSKRPDLNAEFIAHARDYARSLFPELGQNGPEKGVERER